MEKLRELLEPGFISFNGKKWNDQSIDSYNRIQAEINTWIREGRPIPEHLLDASHKCFCLSSGLYGDA